MESIYIGFTDFPIFVERFHQLLGLTNPAVFPDIAPFSIISVLQNPYYISVDYISVLMHHLGYEHEMIFPKQNLAELCTIDFLEFIAGEVEDEEEAILVTWQSYAWKIVFKGAWHHIIRFCDEIYEKFYEGSFVQEHDYIILFPQKKKVCVYHHNNCYSQITLEMGSLKNAVA